MNNVVSAKGCSATAGKFCSGLLDRLDTTGYLIVTDLDFAIDKVADCEKQFLDFCRHLGKPLPHNHDPDTLLWDIKVTDGNSELATFSEVPSVAALHTDNSFSANPDDIFCLMSLKVAECGGGESTLLHVQSILKALRNAPGGEKAEMTLRTKPYPFAVPSIFCKEGSDAFEYNTGLILYDDCIRYREDVIEAALNHHPELIDDEQREALDLLNKVVKIADGLETTLVKPDSMIIIDNKRTLHGRSAFTDKNRHLLRVRLRDVR